MSRTITAIGKQDSVGYQPVPEVAKVLKGIKDLPKVRKVTHERAIPVRCREPHLAFTAVYKDGIGLRVRGGGLVQNTYIKCADPEAVMVAIERAWNRRKYPGLFDNPS